MDSKPLQMPLRCIVSMRHPLISDEILLQTCYPYWTDFLPVWLSQYMNGKFCDE